MSRICSICKRGTHAGATRSHSNIASKRKVKVNIQSKKINGQKTRVCAKCIKTMSKIK